MAEQELKPGDVGYVDPTETPTEEQPSPPAPAIVNTENGGVEKIEDEQKQLKAEIASDGDATVSKASYDKLLLAFESLLVRGNVDILLQHQYRVQAGLV